MNRDRFKNFLCAAVSDSLKGIGVMHPDIKSMVPGKVMAGPAFTVKCYPGSILTVHKALLEAKPGEVLVVDGESDPNGALLGELMALQCKLNGFEGVVIDGCVRDLTGLRDLGFPVFARFLTPRVGTNRRLGMTQIDISCGGIIVHPGDWVMGDDDGVVVIPSDQVDEIVEKAERVEANEVLIAKRINAGEAVADILNMRPNIYPKN